MTRVSDGRARESLDSRGNPTIEVEVELEDGSFGRAPVPSVASTGEFEAVELRDGDTRRYRGKGYSAGGGDGGGFAPDLKSNEEAVEVILEAIEKAGYKAGKDIQLAIDPAASEFYENGKYVFKKRDRSKKSSEQMVAFWDDWVKKYPLVS